MFERVVYGLANDLPAFALLTPVPVGTKLRSMGCDGLFHELLEREWGGSEGLVSYVATEF